MQFLFLNKEDVYIQNSFRVVVNLWFKKTAFKSSVYLFNYRHYVYLLDLHYHQIPVKIGDDPKKKNIYDQGRKHKTPESEKKNIFQVGTWVCKNNFLKQNNSFKPQVKCRASLPISVAHSSQNASLPHFVHSVQLKEICNPQFPQLRWMPLLMKRFVLLRGGRITLYRNASRKRGI